MCRRCFDKAAKDAYYQALEDNYYSHYDDYDFDYQ
jgi:hypothetical protein